MQNLDKELLRKMNARFDGYKTLGIEENLNNFQNNSIKDGFNFESSNYIMKEHLQYLNDNWIINVNTPITSHRKFIGNIIVFIKRAIRKCLRWFISPIIAQQIEFNANNVNVLNQINVILDNIELLLEQQNQIRDDFDKKVNGAQVEINAINTEIDVIKTEIEVIKTENINGLQAEIEEMKAEKISGVQAKVEAIEDENNKLQREFKITEENFNYFRSQFEELKINQRLSGMLAEIESIKAEKTKLLRDIKITEDNFNYFYSQLRLVKQEGSPKADLATGKSDSEITIKDYHTNFNYFLFENKFRGPREEVKKLQEQYIKFFVGKENVLDIGCGRGEFLDLLSESNIMAKGVDINEDFVSFNIQKGHNVILKDALEYLESIEDNSLGGIFMAQVLEHLTEDYIYNLLEMSYKKLKPGCYIVAETPSPLTLAIYYNSFYVDLSHMRPIHPAVMQYLLGYYCFKDIDIILSSKVNYSIPELKIETSNISEFNDAMKQVNDLLFGYQDYAVVGKK